MEVEIWIPGKRNKNICLADWNLRLEDLPTTTIKTLIREWT